MKILIGLVVAIGIVFFSFTNWRRAIKAVFLIVVFEGALRKWVLPQASDLIYFLKDAVLLGAYIQYYGFALIKGKGGGKNTAINILVFLSVLWGAFQVFNPSLGSLVIGLFGFKSYFFYIPMMWMLPDLFPTKDEFYRFIRSHLVLAIPVGLIGAIQFVSPIDSPINSYAWGEELGVAWIYVGNSIRARITGTFSYVNNYSAYLLICFGLLVPLLSKPQTPRWRYASLAAMLLVIVNLLMTGSRGPVFASVLFLIGFLLARTLKQPSSTFALVRRFIPAAIVLTLLIFIFFRPAVNAFLQRTTSNNDISSRLQNEFSQPVEFFQYKELDGYGTGATQKGAPALRRAFDLPPGERIATYYEDEMGRVVLEIGPIGFLLWYGLRLSLIVALWDVFRRSKDPFLAQMALAAFLIHLINIRSQLVFHHTFALYYWFLSSFIFIIPRLEQAENWYRGLTAPVQRLPQPMPAPAHLLTPTE